MLCAKRTVKFLEGSCPSCFDISNPVTNALNGFLAFLIGLIFDYPISEGFVEREIRPTVRELLFDEPFECPQIVDSFSSHIRLPSFLQDTTASGKVQVKSSIM